MHEIIHKYRDIRESIKDGDVILFHGTGILANIIQYCDESNGKKSYHNHVGIIVEKHGALFIVDSNAGGVQADRLSKRIDKYEHGGDFTILRPIATRKQINSEMERILHRSDSKWIKYDFNNGIKELLNRRFDLKLKITLSDDFDICSDYVSRYVINLGMMTEEFSKKDIVFPEDYIRYIDVNNCKYLTKKASE